MNGIGIPVVLVAGVWASLAVGQGRPAVDPQVRVREGFELTVALADLERARFMATDPDGTLYVSQPHLGEAKACRDQDGNGYFERVTPFVVGSKIPRYEYMKRPDIVELDARTIPPAWPTGAHWAPNAMTFYTGEQFPAEHRGDAFVAYHGSWNRDRKAGYCVTRVLFDDGRPYGELVYVNFLTDEGKVLGRPVDVVVAPDGSLLISDDQAGRIYRLSYKRQ